jgi:hypothetical protein
MHLNKTIVRLLIILLWAKALTIILEVVRCFRYKVERDLLYD